MTGSHLKIEPMGDNVQGVRLFCDPSKPEHAEFRVVFPGGSISVVRRSDGTSYWAHVDIQRPGGDPEAELGRITFVRLDSDDDDPPKLADAELDTLYHVAVRVTRRHA